MEADNESMIGMIKYISESWCFRKLFIFVYINGNGVFRLK